MLLAFSLTFQALGATADVTSLSINGGKTLSLSVDDYHTLEVKTTPSNVSIEDISFTSSDTSVATVDYLGNILAKKVGSTTITASINGKKSSITVRVSSVNNLLGITFSVKDGARKGIREITVTPKSYNKEGKQIEREEGEDYNYYIFLPSGYFVEGKSATYAADSYGIYPFTVYDRSGNKRTFYYNFRDESIPENEKKQDKDTIILDYKLEYDYEKKQVLLNLKTDKIRTIVTPGGTKSSNEANYYIGSLKNNTPLDFSVSVDGVSYRYKVLRQGEFYLLVFISPVNYDSYSSIVSYNGYNFTTGESYTTLPGKDIFYDNGNYRVLVQSDSMTKEVFNFSVDGMDFRRPDVDISFYSDSTFGLKMEDDFGLDYLITFDGKFVALTGKSQTYEHKTDIAYNGSYMFTVVDKAGNRTALAYEVTSKRNHRTYKIDYSVHNYRNTKSLFSDIGLEYSKDTDKTEEYELIFPAYMKGISSGNFYPDAPITRAEIITLFCRLTDLPYDNQAILKNKFTDISSHWAKDYIAMGSAKKYVSGYKDKTFKPDNPVTRAEFCQMVTNISAFKSKVSALPATKNPSYADISSHWALKQIVPVTSRDILKGNGDYFYPDRAITRGEVVNAINSIYGFNPTAGELSHMDSLYKKYFGFEDIKNHVYYNDIVISVIGMYREKSN